MAITIEATQKSLQRVQEFDISTLPREAELGQAMSFTTAVEPAQRVIDLFRQFPLQFLADLPDNQLQQIRSTADAFYNQLQEIINFDPKSPDAWQRRESLIQTLRDRYQNVFNDIFSLISFGASRQRDFARIEQDFRASIQRSEDAATDLMKRLEEQEAEGKRIIDEVRKVAAEQGVSQQAAYFRDESGLHKTESDGWRNWTLIAAGTVAAFAVLSIFLHKIPGLAPSNAYEAIQLTVSKILIFTVMGYVLLLCARNFLSHKHNEIVNKHRQNALLTFKALVEAAGTAERRDVILTYAAACIFSPQETGYTKSGGDNPKQELPMNIIQAIPKLVTDSK